MSIMGVTFGEIDLITLGNLKYGTLFSSFCGEVRL